MDIEVQPEVTGSEEEIDELRADDAKKPYGDVTYADPGYQDDGKKRYPIDTEEHVRAAWSYINQQGNASKYTTEQLSSIKGRIKSAAKKFGIDISDDQNSFKPLSVNEVREMEGLSPLRPAALLGAPERRTMAVKVDSHVDSASNSLILRGYASVFDNGYPVYGGPASGGWTETVDRRAFDKTLASNPDLHLLINHEGLPLARTKSGTLRLSTDERGLLVEADLDRSDPDVQRLEAKMRRGDMDEMSFAFRTIRDEWNEERSDRQLIEVSLDKGDVSVVNWGANPATHASISTEDALRHLASLSPAEMRGAAYELHPDVKSQIANVLKLVAAADEAVDQAQPMLAKVIGVPNPDMDDMNASGEQDNDAMPGRAAEAEVETVVTYTPPEATTAVVEDEPRKGMSLAEARALADKPRSLAAALKEMGLSA